MVATIAQDKLGHTIEAKTGSMANRAGSAGDGAEQAHETGWPVRLLLNDGRWREDTVEVYLNVR
jgi:hypothetical protein